MLRRSVIWLLVIAAAIAALIVIAPLTGFSASAPGNQAPPAQNGETEPSSSPGQLPTQQPAPTPPDQPVGSGNPSNAFDPNRPVSSNDPTPTPNGSTPTGSSGGSNVNVPMKKELAPIEQVEILVQESMPPRYVAKVTYGLPSGCAQPGGNEVKREGNTVEVTVWIQLPADPQTVCTMIYGIDEVNIPLGADFTAGQTYTVKVNDQSTTFTAQ